MSSSPETPNENSHNGNTSQELEPSRASGQVLRLIPLDDTVAEVADRVRLPGGGRAVLLSGQHRALIGAAQTGPEGELRVEVQERPDESTPAGEAPPVRSKRLRELEREYRAVAEEIL